MQNAFKFQKRGKVGKNKESRREAKKRRFFKKEPNSWDTKKKIFVQVLFRIRIAALC